MALGVTDRVQASLAEVFPRSGEAAAAVVVLGYAPGMAIETLRQALGRSHPGTVRLVDRLAEDGLLERRKAEDGRAVALHLTHKGKTLRRLLMERRLATLAPMLEGLSAEERKTLGELLSKVLRSLPETEMDKHNICRLCAVSVCVKCPIPGSAI